MEKPKNIYKGNRYVPKIMGEWDKLKNYEGLSIVLNEGNSYTSKKGVPVGIELTNENYWSSTGNYNVQIENYRQDVREVQTNLTILEQETTAQFQQILFNVKFFGAKGDGVTDDTQAVRNALNLIRKNKGGTLYFPIGTYLVSGSESPSVSPVVNFNADVSNLHIKGESKKNTIIKVADGELKESLFGNYFKEDLKNIEISGLNFDLNGKNNLVDIGTRPSKAVFLTYYVDGLDVHDCIFDESPGEHIIYAGAPFSQDNAKKIRIHDNEVNNTSDCIVGNVNVIDHSSFFSAGSDVLIYNNVLKNKNKVSKVATGIECNSIDAFIYNNTIEGYQIPFITASLSGAWQGAGIVTQKNIKVRNLKIYNNIVRECRDGWLIENPIVDGVVDVSFYENDIKLINDVTFGSRYLLKCLNKTKHAVKNISITKNKFSSTGNFLVEKGYVNGIFVDYYDGLFIDDNIFSNLGGPAIRVISKDASLMSKRLSVHHNDITDVCGNSIDGFVSAVTLQGSTENGNINNNNIKNDKLAYCKNGIELFSLTSVFNDISISDNKVKDVESEIRSDGISQTNIADVVIKHMASSVFDVRQLIKATFGSIIVTKNAEYHCSIDNKWIRKTFGEVAPANYFGNLFDYHVNTNPRQLGDVGSRYIINGWRQVSDGVVVKDTSPTE